MIETLRTLPEKIDVWVLMGSADAMEQSVKQLLVAYRSETDKLVFHYIDPDRDVTAPISVRPNAMELLWVCGDCGQHYPRARECPDKCTECGAPKQHFYAPIED